MSQDKDAKKARRVMDAMLRMDKIDVSALRRPMSGDSAPHRHGDGHHRPKNMLKVRLRVSDQPFN